MYSRAQRSGGSAATLVLIIILVLILYVIFLPPEERELLLEGEVGDGQFVQPSLQAAQEFDAFTFEGPGLVDFVNRNQYIHDIPAQTVRVDQSADEIFEENDFTVTNSWTQTRNHDFKLNVPDLNAIENPIMRFTAVDPSGTLTVLLNGQQIYNRQLTDTSTVAVKIRQDQLLPTNTVEFQVSSVGFAFWRQNKYIISELDIIADTLDFSRSSGQATFSLRTEEITNIERTNIRFTPECTQADGILTGYINGQQIFAVVPDCGILNRYDIDNRILREGANTVAFTTSEGTYLLDNIRVTTELDDDRDYTYFFTLDEDLFSFNVEEEPACGQFDGYCPENCGEDVDQDCCFEQYDDGFWCDVPTTLRGDRCVGSVTEFNFLRCPSGYEDESGDVQEDFEGVCGDDNDNFCPTGCSIYYDQDCCLDRDINSFWCEDLPSTGVQDICVTEVSQDMCDLCPLGYDGNNGDPDNCFVNENPLFEEVTLREDFRATAEFIFLDDRDFKEATVIINGFATRIDTSGDYVQIDISEYVKDNSNYIEIRPESRFNLVEVRVNVEDDQGKPIQRRDPGTNRR